MLGDERADWGIFDNLHRRFNGTWNGYRTSTATKGWGCYSPSFRRMAYHLVAPPDAQSFENDERDQGAGNSAPAPLVIPSRSEASRPTKAWMNSMNAPKTMSPKTAHLTQPR